MRVGAGDTVLIPLCAVTRLRGGADKTRVVHHRRRGRWLTVTAETAQQPTEQRNTAQCAKQEEHSASGLDARILGAR